MCYLNELVGHWGYAAVFLVVILGNLGIPVPEEGVLILAGYLVWEGKLRLVMVLAVAVMSAVAGDNIGYLLGKRFGRQAIMRYGWRIAITSERLKTAEGFMVRQGLLAVYLARFLPGLRFLAGPLAGTLGMQFQSFFVANLLGAATYVPVAVAAGYVVGYGFGDTLENLRQVIGRVEHFGLIAVVFLTILLIIWRVFRARKSSST